MATVLIADDEPNIRRMVGALLGVEGYDVRDAGSGIDALEQASDGEVDVVLLDMMMPGQLDGMATLAKLREKNPELPVIMMSGRAGLSDAVTATRLGAFNFLEKPLSPEGVLLAIQSALELSRTRRVARELREELGLAGDMVGASDAMSAVRAMIARLAASESRVLITGESGTGKELVASAIHDGSARRDKPFIRVNCAAIPRDLLESEMFGHERGAFTGATQTRVGRFELAHRGTLFLDEVGDLSLEAQAKLLRAIEASEIQRVGGARTIQVDVRILAATNHDLGAAVRNGTFREDLFFRLNVIPLHLPPLRDRGRDSVELITHFSALHHRKTGQKPPEWSEGAIAAMSRYAWPGNVRELANIVERLAILRPGCVVDGAEVEGILSPVASHAAATSAPGYPDSGRGLGEQIDAFERTLIARALSRSDGNISEAARKLETDRANLYRRMKRLGLP